MTTINLYLRHELADKGSLIGTVDPVVDDMDALLKAVRQWGVGGEQYDMCGQFIDDERGSGFEIAYCDPERAA